MDPAIEALAFEGQIRDNFQQVARRDSRVMSLAMDQEEKKELQNQGFNKQASLDDLIRRSLEGDTLAMEAIYLEYKRPVFNLAYRYTYDAAVAEDLLQEIFLKIFTHLKDVQRVETFVGWLYRIAINTCYSYLRQKRSKLQKTLSLSEIEGKMEEATYDSPHQEMKRQLDEAIKTLPKKLKSIFLLHDVQGFKHEEIARILGCSVGTSKSQLFKARMKLRQLLKNKQIL